jgi:hypothetical protein
MNERIEKLSQGCFEYIEGTLDGDIVEFDYKKFAELIIRECLGDLKERIALRYQGSDYDRAVGYGMEIVYYDIVDKFGVDENLEFDHKSES